MGDRGRETILVFPKGEEGKEKVGKGVESGSTVLRKPLSIIDWGETTERRRGNTEGLPGSRVRSFIPISSTWEILDPDG